MRRFVLWEAKGEIRDTNGEAKKVFPKRTGICLNTNGRYGHVFRQYKELGDATHTSIDFYSM